MAILYEWMLAVNISLYILMPINLRREHHEEISSFLIQYDIFMYSKGKGASKNRRRLFKVKDY